MLETRRTVEEWAILSVMDVLQLLGFCTHRLTKQHRLVGFSQGAEGIGVDHKSTIYAFWIPDKYLRMKICITHFGSDEFYSLLKLWLEQYLRSGCSLDVVILADRKVTLPAEFKPYDSSQMNRFSVARFDPIPDVVRPRRPFDIKGSLILSGIELISDDRIFLVDSDAFFIRNPSQDLAYLSGAFCMGEDPMTRFIRGVNPEIKERNAGVLFFGTTNPEHRKTIREKFIENFKSLLPANDGPLLEQITWTKTWHDLRGTLSGELPRSLNWSYMWGRSDPKTIVLHEHGPQKWARISGVNPQSKNIRICHAP
jgi:hypothetical protein